RSVALAALYAAGVEEDLPGQAAARLSIGMLDARQGCYNAAIEHGEQALALARTAGWAPAQSAARRALVYNHAIVGPLNRAAQCLTAALELDRDNGRGINSTVLLNLGYTRCE